MIKRVLPILFGFLGLTSYAQKIPVELKSTDIIDGFVKEGERVIASPLGDVLYFNGKDAAFFSDINLMEGLTESTVEVTFKPLSSGNPAQRFLHFGTPGGERIVLETRLNQDSTWYFDAYLQRADGAKVALIDSTRTHPTDRWYNVVLIIYKTMVVTYVNGIPQSWANFVWEPMTEGRTAIGARMNKNSWFHGLIYSVKITPSSLLPRDFSKDYLLLNEEEDSESSASRKRR